MPIGADRHQILLKGIELTSPMTFAVNSTETVAIVAVEAVISPEPHKTPLVLRVDASHGVVGEALFDPQVFDAGVAGGEIKGDGHSRQQEQRQAPGEAVFGVHAGTIVLVTGSSSCLKIPIICQFNAYYGRWENPGRSRSFGRSTAPPAPAQKSSVTGEDPAGGRYWCRYRGCRSYCKNRPDWVVNHKDRWLAILLWL